MKAATLKAAIWEASNDNGERNDCTVKALAITTGCSYDAVHAAMKAEGRRNRGRSSVHSMIRAAKRLGFEMAKRPRNGYRAKTVRTAGRDSLIGNSPVILSTSGHVAAMKGGEVVDWTEGRLHRIRAVYDITPRAVVVAPALLNIPAPKMPQTNGQMRLF